METNNDGRPCIAQVQKFLSQYLLYDEEDWVTPFVSVVRWDVFVVFVLVAAAAVREDDCAVAAVCRLSS